MWDEAEELVDEPPLPERVGRKVRRASREIGEDVSSEVEKLGGRLRGWSQDVGRTAERFTEDLGDGIQRAGRSGRRWIGGDDDRADEAALYDVDVDEGAKRKMMKEKMEKKKEQKVRPRVAEVEREMGLEEKEEGRNRWSWLGWRRRSKEERLPEDRIADVKFKSDVDLVCVDSSIASDQAFRYALRNIPRGHTLLLVHGIFAPPGAIDSKIEDEREMRRVKNKFLTLCERNGRRCAYREFEFATNSELGEKVCGIADRLNAGSVILGKRAAASEARRAVLGSPSLSVMQQCNAPVTLVAERKEGSFN
jgi:nucleotide-binding universal stress UspA family protein